ncbi:hypothetical protein AJ80_06306 [Polytolypa hystricis UAMH7299]|uniref:Glucanase n=1 Tax=Polytolypa hystricis (strain UAMH7299) TaxID=1447883 RepID=A0A2B7XY83_POLH7|nr:hypothetical protein AJ80_06306 [Polytolypa hystricis UAMH7299]
MYRKAAILSSLLASAYAQQAGTEEAETHPKMTWQDCSAGGSCTTKNGEVVLDSNWRWVHEIGGYTNCYTGNAWDEAICSDNESCAQNCAIDGADYSGTYGVTASGNELNLKFVTEGPEATNVGSRLYMMASPDKYEMYKLLNREFTFDVDVSSLGCGLNGALYFVSMPEDGGLGTNGNQAGAEYGTGYCDSQCPRDLKFIDGLANFEGWNSAEGDENAGVGGRGACCAELDVWEANAISSAFTPHPCDTPGLTVCEGEDCGGTYSETRYAGTCDPDGCDFNPYRQGDPDFYGEGKTVDTTKKMTVVTQFLTDDGTDSGTLNEIRRFYVQDGQVIPNSESKIAEIPGDSLTQEFCDAQKQVFGDENTFEQHGGWKNMSDAMAEGMVLVMSLWDDRHSQMLWLDSTYPVDAPASQLGAGRGECATDSGAPDDVRVEQAGASVTFGNIKYGPIGSTFDAPA